MKKYIIPIIIYVLILYSVFIFSKAYHQFSSLSPCMKKIMALKPGMTRADVLKDFKFDRCVPILVKPSTPSKSADDCTTEVFILSHCLCGPGKVYTIAVDFKPAHTFTCWNDIRKNYNLRNKDKIIKVTKPVCEAIKTYEVPHQLEQKGEK